MASTAVARYYAYKATKAVELYRQLLGRAGERGVAAERGLTCNVGGFGNCVTTALLEVGE